MTGFNFKNKGKAFIFLAAVAFISYLLISGCGQVPQDKTQSSLIDKQNSITTTDHNRRLFSKYSHGEIRFGYAVRSCFVKLGGNFLVDGYNSFCGGYKQNQNISGGSVAYVSDIKINGRNVRITGQVVQVQTCEVDVSQIIDKARQSNNNSVIPPQFIKDGKLKLENNDKLTLPSGTYYFKEIKVSGRAVLEFSGPTTVVVEGDVSVDSQGQIKTNPVFLKIISTGKVKVEGQGAIYAGVLGDEVKVDGKGQIFGGVISREFKGEGQGAVHFDKGLGLDRVEVFPSEVTIKVGETVQLTASARDIFGNEISCVVFEWSSSDPGVAVVDQNGLVQGVGEGRAIVSATAKKEGYNLAFKEEAIVNVIPAGPVECSLTLIRNAPVVSGGGFHTCAIKQDGSLWCWGNNFYGQLGNGRSGIGEMSSIPVQIMSSGVVAVSAGGFHTCAIKQDGSLWCWGWNQYGQVGDGTNTDRNTPVQIMPGGVIAVSAGWAHTCAIKQDGSLWCWGWNQYGQVGDGTWESKNSPVQIMSEGVVAVALGWGGHTCAIKQGGSLWCWGWNEYGQVGDGTWESKNSPVQIMSEGVVAVALGWNSTVALKTDCSVWNWGGRTRINIPIMIMSGVPAVSICAGAGHGCMVMTNGSLWCGGHNEFGQLGDGTWETKFDILVQTMPEGAEVVYCGAGHTCSIKQDGSLWCWGANMFGQLGDGTDVNRNTPVQIMSIR